MDKKREYIIKELMVKDFAEWESEDICLEETEDSGRSILTFHLQSDEVISIKNVDKKKTEMNFFQTTAWMSMFKRVDHILFEHVKENAWNLHLIEMKSSVSNEKWTEIKGKFRSSYLVACGIAAMWDMNIVHTYMYTTYERTCFFSETMPVERRPRLGQPLINPEEEWNKKEVNLNFGEKIKFLHAPIKMERDTDGVLIGSWT